MNRRMTIVLDSYKYKIKEHIIKNEIKSLCSPNFIYTDYENRLIKFFHGIPHIGNVITHLLYWFVSFSQAAILLQKKRSQDLILFVNPIVGFFYCLMLSIFQINGNIVVAGFLFAPKDNNFYLNIRKKIVGFAYKKARKIIVYSNLELAEYSIIFPKLSSKFKFVPYGRDFDIFQENEYISKEKYVATGGGSNRDFQILENALKQTNKHSVKVKFKIATRPECFTNHGEISNLEVIYGIRLDRFGSFLSKSKFIIIPLKDKRISAGHMTLLESMYRGKIILITDFPVVRDYVSSNEVYFFKANDSNDLSEKINYLLSNTNNSKVKAKAEASKIKYDNKYMFKFFIKRLVHESIV